jgi:hypothetical protein
MGKKMPKPLLKTSVFVDIDMDYALFMSNIRYFEEHMNWVFDKLKLDVKPIGYRVLPSTNNNTHVIIYLDKAVTDLEELHLATALGGDYALYLNARQRYEILGYSDKVRFPKGEKHERTT